MTKQGKFWSLEFVILKSFVSFNLAFVIYLAAVLSPALSYASNDFSSKKTALSPLCPPGQTISPGEHLQYDVFWMGVPVGLGELWVKEKTMRNGRWCYHVMAVAETNDFLSKIYPVRDEVHSWIDAQDLQSLQFEKKVSEGRYKAHERVLYDSDRKQGHYVSIKNGSKKDFSVAVPVQDILSAFYWARRQTLIPGKSVRTTVNSDEKDWDLEIHVLSRQNKFVRGLGDFDTLLIEPKTLLKGVLEKRGRVWINLENSPARTPIFITFKTPFGPIVGVLKR